VETWSGLYRPPAIRRVRSASTFQGRRPWLPAIQSSEGSIGRSDLPGGNFEELGRSVAALAQIDEVELLLPGHMGRSGEQKGIRRNFDLIQRMFFGH